MKTTFKECTDNKTKETVISGCSEMRTEGTSRPSVGMRICMLSRLLRTETKDFESPAIRAHAALGSPPLTWPRCQAVPLGHEQRRTGTLRVRTACVSRVFGIVAIAKQWQLRFDFWKRCLGSMAWGSRIVNQGALRVMQS